MERGCSVLVLNWNGRHLLEEYLPSVVEAVAEEGPQHEVVLVDNASTDDSVAWVQANLPTVRIRHMETNDRLFSYNTVVAEVDRPYVALLNNDVRVLSRPFLAPLLRHFHDPDVFAVTPKVLSDNPLEVFEHRCPGVFKRGYLLTGRWENLEGPGYTLLAHGGAAVYDREKFLELGGFDRLYWPEYTQDVDLSWRAWAHGWTILFEPESAVFHQGGATISRQGPKERVAERGALIFGLKNYQDPAILGSFLLWNTLRLGKALAIDQWTHALAYWDAFRLAPSILNHRNKTQKDRHISDSEIFRTILSESSPSVARRSTNGSL